MILFSNSLFLHIMMENRGILIERIDMASRTYGVPYEAVIVDDNSPDGTADKTEELSKIPLLGLL